VGAYLRRGMVLAVAGLSLAVAGPAQAQDQQIPISICTGAVGVGCVNPEQSQSNTQTSTQTTNQNNNQSVVVQQQQSQQQGGGGGGVTREVHVVRDRHHFVRPAARRRVFFVRGVRLARTGFDAWMLALAGVGCMAGGLALMARRRRGSAQT
jgi:LPXTG-motif cell wall-anchored protein